MPALTIKNIPDALYQQLKTSAELHRRSINSEVIVCLEKTLAATRISPADRLSRIEQLRSSIKSNSITPEDIEQAINSGATMIVAHTISSATCFYRQTIRKEQAGFIKKMPNGLLPAFGVANSVMCLPCTSGSKS